MQLVSSAFRLCQTNMVRCLLLVLVLFLTSAVALQPVTRRAVFGIALVGAAAVHPTVTSASSLRPKATKVSSAIGAG